MAKVRINNYYDVSDIDYLRNRGDLTVSEHIRRALDEYIARMRKTELNVSSSSSINGSKK